MQTVHACYMLLLKFQQTLLDVPSQEIHVDVLKYQEELVITIDSNCKILVVCAYSVVGHTSVGEVSLS